LRDYCGYRETTFDLNRDFSCFYGPNGCGKTTALNVIMTLCSSLDYRDDMRRKMALKPYIRDGAASFEVNGLFEHEGKEYEVVFTQDGFEKNEILNKEFWWPGLAYFAKFDADTRVFCLPSEKWERFKEYYDGIFGYNIEPDFYEMDDGSGEKETIVAGFYLYKPQGKVSFERASAGEKKAAKSLSQIVNLPDERLPNIVLVDNLEMHVYYRRHLTMFETVKNMFEGMQVISTTHSTVVVENYEPKTDLIDVEQFL